MDCPGGLGRFVSSLNHKFQIYQSLKGTMITWKSGMLLDKLQKYYTTDGNINEPEAIPGLF